MLPCLGYIAGVNSSGFPALVTLLGLPCIGYLSWVPCTPYLALVARHWSSFLGYLVLVTLPGFPCIGYIAWVALPWLPSSGCLALGYLALVTMQWWPCCGYHALKTLPGEGVGPGGVCTCCLGSYTPARPPGSLLVICLVSLFPFLIPVSVTLHFPLYSFY